MKALEPEEQDVIVHAGFERYALMTDEQVVIMANEEESGTALEYILHKYKNFVRAKARSYFLIGADKEDIVQEGICLLYTSASAGGGRSASVRRTGKRTLCKNEQRGQGNTQFFGVHGAGRGIPKCNDHGL